MEKKIEQIGKDIHEGRVTPKDGLAQIIDLLEKYPDHVDGPAAAAMAATLTTIFGGLGEV